ncbi:MAG: glycosyltransferase family 2 protein [Arcobacteraceae bacterium]|nr:glycosyltransferase family 2 protein [Arcobacteraceae bacterium]
MKLISIVTPCFNEQDNVEELYSRVKATMGLLDNYRYEHIFIDNASTDNTVNILKSIANQDRNVKVIVNSRNFGHMCSPVYGMFQASGDVIISIVSDLQDPPEMIPNFIKEWESGNDIVLAIKQSSEENKLMFKIRKLYYNLLSKLSEVEVFKNYTGFGLYDKKVMNAVKELKDPYPFFRGMIAEVGFKVSKISYDQPVRLRGITKNNFYTLYDIGMLGIINNSKVPLRMAIFMGVFFGIISLLVGFGYFIAKLLYWDTMSLGVAPLIIMSSLMFSIMLFFIGIIGEYIGAIYTQVLNRPLVFEKERINFDQ